MLTFISRNYTGDVLNFGLAKEQYVALHPEKAECIKFVIVGDDVAVDRAQGKIVGRRYGMKYMRQPPECQLTFINYSGLAGTVLVYKIAGALASRGGSLDQVYFMATWIASRIATIGVSVGHTHVRFLNCQI